MNKGRSTLAIGSTIAVIAALFLLVRVAAARDNVGSPVRQSLAGHTISVSGHGEVQVTPDMATITLGVETHASDAQTALSDNATRMNAVIAAIEAQGILPSRIQTTDLSLWYDSQKNSYVVDHSLTVRLDGTDKVGAVLDSAVHAGATMSWGVSFDLHDRTPAQQSALTAAINNAHAHAQAIAGALGVSINGVGSASEATYNVQPPQPVFAAAPQASASNQTPVQAGQLTITADVNVTYTFGG